MNRREDLVCAEATSAGLDTLICRWDPLTKKKPVFQSCWNCFCNTKQSCSIGGQPLDSPEEPEEEEVANQPANTQAGPSHSSNPPPPPPPPPLPATPTPSRNAPPRAASQAARASSLVQHQPVGPSHSTPQVAEASSSAYKDKGRPPALSLILDKDGKPVNLLEPLSGTSIDPLVTRCLEPDIASIISGAQGRLAVASDQYQQVMNGFVNAEYENDDDPFHMMSPDGGYTYLALATAGVSEASSILNTWSDVLAEFSSRYQASIRIYTAQERERVSLLTESLRTAQEEISHLKDRFEASERTAARFGQQVGTLTAQLQSATDDSESTLADITQSRDLAVSDRNISEKVRLDLRMEVDGQSERICELEAMLEQRDGRIEVLEEELEELHQAEAGNELELLAFERKTKHERSQPIDLESSPSKKPRDASVP